VSPAAITPEKALARVQSLVASRPDEPLAVVVEARFYAEHGLLKQEDVLGIAGQALGEEKLAEMLASLPGAGLGQAIGGSVGFGGLLDLMRGVNSAANAAKGGGAAPGAGSKPGGGLGGLIPLGLPFGGAGKGKPAVANQAAPNAARDAASGDAADVSSDAASNGGARDASPPEPDPNAGAAGASDGAAP
jgi:hypothetical protein